MSQWIVFRNLSGESQAKGPFPSKEAAETYMDQWQAELIEETDGSEDEIDELEDSMEVLELEAPF